MSKRLSIPLFFLVLAFSLSLNIVYAVDSENQVDLNNFPARLAEAFNISDFAAGILASMLVMFMFILPVAMFTKRNIIPPLLVGFLVMGFCIAINWLPYWFLLIVVIMVALMFSGKMRDLISGGN